MASRKRRAQAETPASAATGTKSGNHVKPRKLKPRDAKVVDGLKEGKSMRKAVLEAGYSEYTAEHPDAIEKRLQDQLAELMPSVETIAEKINEGCDAIETQSFSHVLGSKLKGTEQIKVQSVDKIAWTERRKYLELSLILRGLMPGKPSITLQPGGNGGGKFIVEFVNVAQLDEA